LPTSVEMCEKILEETGVALLPGMDFGHQPEELVARLAYVDFDGKSVMKTVESVYAEKKLTEDFIRETCPSIWEGTHKLIAWFQGL
jgi:aspartate aminotransferase